MNRPDHEESLFFFVTGDEFRSRLLSDYREMLGSLASKSWKAVHVLAGSVIEAILIDHLVAVKYSNQPTEQLLKLDLGKAIAACKSLNNLSEKTAQLCAVVQDYRNLIHPGRIIRLKEEVTAEGANVAVSLVKMVLNEVARNKKEVYGYTAEQILEKIEADTSSSMAIFPMLLQEVNPTELGRLLLTVIPERNFYLCEPEQEYGPAPVFHAAFRRCFRLALERADPETQRKVAERYVKILKEQSQEYREAYEKTCFQADDMQYLPTEANRALVKSHLFALLRDAEWSKATKLATGIGKYIIEKDVYDGGARAIWVQLVRFASVRSVVSPLQTWVVSERWRMPSPVDTQFREDMARNVKMSVPGSSPLA